MLSLLGSVPAPDHPWSDDVQTAFYIGGLPIRWYAIFIMFGFILAIVAACLKMWKRYKISTEPFYWFIIIGVPAAILGARFGSCAIGDADWANFFDFRSGGLAIEWGVVLTTIIAFIYFPLVLKRPNYRVKDEFSTDHQVKRISFWMYADAIIPCILIGQFLGRWGNYFNQEVFGAMVTDQGLAQWLHDHLPWMYLSEGNRYLLPAGYYQPLFLWEGIGNIIMFFVFYFGFEFIKQRKAGDLAAGYFVWYGTFRLCLEPLRSGQFKFIGTFVMSGIFVALGVIFILLNHLVIAKVRDKKIWHTLFKYGPKEVFTMINCGWHIEKNIRYKDRQYADCVRQPQEMIYFGAW